MASEELIAGAIITAGGGLGAMLRWAVGRITKALDDNTAALTKNATEAAVQAETNRAMTSKIERLADWIDHLSTPEREPAQLQPSSSSRAATQPGRARSSATPAKGAQVIDGRYGAARPGTRGDE